MEKNKAPEGKNIKPSPRISAGMISILLMLCLLLAVGAFAMSAIMRRQNAEEKGAGLSKSSESHEFSDSSDDRFAQASEWLGIDTIQEILAPDAGQDFDSAEDAPAEESSAASAENSHAAAASTASAEETPVSARAASSSPVEKSSAAAASTGASSAQDSTDASDTSTAKVPVNGEAAEEKSVKAEAGKESTDKDSASKKEDESAESSDSAQSESAQKQEDSLTSRQKKYVRAWEDYHGRSFPLNAALHDYNWKYLSFDENGILHYKGDKNYTVRRGIDVSEFQGKIDWDKVKKAGCDFVFVRAGSRTFHTGTLSKDSRAVKNLRRAKKAGLEVGVYVFSQAVTRKEAREEAQLCLDVIAESGVEVTLPIAFDPEIQVDYYARLNDISGEQFTDNTLAFCDTIKKAGYTPAVYANCSTETDILDMSRLEDVVIWYADYGSPPESPYRFTFWQYSSLGRVDGIPETETDLNVWFVENKEDN